MKRTALFLAVIAFCAVSSVYAMYSITEKGTWPESWPKELEPLRKQSRTLMGGLFNQTYYVIPFTKRADVEAAWPHILKIKSKGAPVFLVRGPDARFGTTVAGILIYAALARSDQPTNSELPLPGTQWVGNEREQWTYTTFIELVVDGNIVDLNRLPLPPDTPIIDERFKETLKK